MTIEQVLTLVDLPDGVYSVEGYSFIKKANSISLFAKGNHLAFASKMGLIKTADTVTQLEVEMPGAVSAHYTNGALEKIAEKEKRGSLEDRVQRALVRLSEDSRPMPDVDSLCRLSGLMNIGKQADVLTLKFAQWGGMGNMLQSTQRGGTTSGDVNMMSDWQSNLTMDTALDSCRGDKKMWYLPQEEKLARVGYWNHQYADANANQYNLTWSERIRQKNLAKLKRLWKNNREREEREKGNSPENIRMNDPINPRHYNGIEGFLDDIHQKVNRDYDPNDMKHGRLDERVPDWYAKLHTLRKNASKIKLSGNSILAPSRRGLDENNDKIYGGPADAAAGQLKRDYTLTQILGSPDGMYNDEPTEKVEENDQSITQYRPEALLMNHYNEKEQGQPAPSALINSTDQSTMGTDGRINLRRRTQSPVDAIVPEDEEGEIWNQNPKFHNRGGIQGG